MKKREFDSFQVSDFFFKLEKYGDLDKKFTRHKKRDGSSSQDPKPRSQKIIINFEKKHNLKKKNNQFFQNQICSSKMTLTPGFQNHRRSLFTLNSKKYKILLHKRFKDRNHLKFCDIEPINNSNINYNNDKEVILINNKLFISILKFDFKNEFHFFQKYCRINKFGQFFNSCNFFEKKFSNFLIYTKNDGSFFIDDYFFKKNYFRGYLENCENSFAFEKNFCLVNKNTVNFYDLRDLSNKIFHLKNNFDSDFIYQIEKKSNSILVSTEKNTFLYDKRNLSKKLNLNSFSFKDKKKNFKIDYRKSIFINDDEIVSMDFVKNKLNLFNIKKNEKKQIDNFSEKIIDISFQTLDKKLLLLTEKKENLNQNLLTYKISKKNSFIPDNEIILPQNHFCYKRANFFGENGKIVLHDKINFNILSQELMK